MRRLVLLAVLALGTTAAQADSGLFYLGAGVTDSSLTANNGGFIAYAPTDLKHNEWKAFAGVRPLNWLAVEADYIDLGSGSSGSTLSDTFTSYTHADSSAWAAYAIGFLPVPLPMVNFYGKVGVACWQLKENLIDVSNFPPPSTSIYPRSLSGTDFAWGIGVQAHVKMFGVRLEYEGLEVNNNTANVASLSVSVFLNL
jgi:outer membrane protein with beta-barrel domain